MESFDLPSTPNNPKENISPTEVLQKLSKLNQYLTSANEVLSKIGNSSVSWMFAPYLILQIRHNLEEAFDYGKIKALNTVIADSQRLTNEHSDLAGNNTQNLDQTETKSNNYVSSIIDDFREFINQEWGPKRLAWDLDRYQGVQLIESLLSVVKDLKSQNLELPTNFLEASSKSFIEVELLQFLKVARYCIENDRESSRKIDLECKKLETLLLPIVNQSFGVYLSKLINSKGVGYKRLNEVLDEAVSSNKNSDPSKKLVEYAHWCLNQPSVHIGWKLFAEFADQICGNQVSTSGEKSILQIKENRMRWKYVFGLISQILPELNLGKKDKSTSLNFSLSASLPPEILARIASTLNDPVEIGELVSNRIQSNQNDYTQEFKLTPQEIKFLAQYFVYHRFQAADPEKQINLDSVIDALSNYTDLISAQAHVWNAYTALLTLQTQEQKLLELAETSLEDTLNASEIHQIENTNSLVVVLDQKHNVIQLPDFTDPDNKLQYIDWLNNEGMKKFLENAISNMNLDNLDLNQTINISFSGMDGSTEILSEELYRRQFEFPPVEIDLEINGLNCHVRLTIDDTNHHSPLPLARKIDGSSSTQRLGKLILALDTTPKANHIRIMVCQAKISADTDMTLSKVFIDLEDNHPDLAREYLQVIKVLAALVDSVDKTAGAPPLSLSESLEPPHQPMPESTKRAAQLKKVIQYLNLQWLFLPYSTRTTINRHDRPDLGVFKIFEMDKQIFAKVAEFIHIKQLKIDSPEALVEDFYAKFEDPQFKKDLRSMFEKIKQVEAYEEFIAHSDLLKEQEVDCYPEESNILNQESEHTIFPIKINAVKIVNIAFLHGHETIATKAYLVSACKADIILLPKSNELIQQPESQVVTLGVLNYDDDTILLNSLLANVLSILWDLLNNTQLNQGKSYIQGGSWGGTRDFGTGVWEHGHNKELIGLFTDSVNSLIKEGRDLSTITPKMVTDRIWIDNLGNVNTIAVNTFSHVMNSNIVNFSRSNTDIEANKVTYSTNS